MPKITKIEQQKNKNRVNIFVDDSFFCGLNKETAVIFGLKVGRDIDEEKLQEAIFESEVKSAFAKATDFIAVRMHSKKELFEKLLKKGFQKDAIKKAIEKLEEYGYVDDKLFAKEFVQCNKRFSKRMLEAKLNEKGVDKVVASDVLAGIEDDEQEELCLKMAEKYLKSKNVENNQDLQKMYASLLRKGFEFDMVKRVSKNLVKFDDD